MQQHIPSRLARSQGKKITKQSVRTIVLSVAGILLFVFVLMPQLIQLFFRLIGTGDVSFQSADTVPPQVPILTPLPEATKEDTVTLHGFGEADSQLVIVINGEEKERIGINSQGEFSTTATLAEGDNTIAVYGVDAAKNESQPRTVRIALDKEAPSLAFEDLEDGKEVTLRANQNLEIRGETEPGSQLTLNDRIVFVSSDGTFRTTYHLDEGENELEFEAVDKAGNETKREVTVRFRL